MIGLDNVIVVLIIIALIILLMRLIGAWMLRINEIISLQRQILEELRKINAHKE